MYLFLIKQLAETKDLYCELCNITIGTSDGGVPTCWLTVQQFDAANWTYFLIIKKM